MNELSGESEKKNVVYGFDQLFPSDESDKEKRTSTQLGNHLIQQIENWCTLKTFKTISSNIKWIILHKDVYIKHLLFVVAYYYFLIL